MYGFTFVVRANYAGSRTKYYSLNDFAQTLSEARELIIKNMNEVFEHWEGLKLKRIEDENGKLILKF